MIRAVVFDADGMVITGGRFSVHLEKDYGISAEKVSEFFENDFEDCKVGKADLKERLQPYLKKWGWEGTVDELLEYWFKSEQKLDQGVIAVVTELRQGGTRCYLATDQEKYRTNYIINDMGLGQVFDAVVSSVVVGHQKTEAEFYPKLFETMRKDIPDLKPEEVLFWDHEDKKRDPAEVFGLKTEHYEGLDQFKEALRSQSVL